MRVFEMHHFNLTDGECSLATGIYATFAAALKATGCTMGQMALVESSLLPPSDPVIRRWIRWELPEQWAISEYEIPGDSIDNSVLYGAMVSACDMYLNEWPIGFTGKWPPVAEETPF